MGFKPPELLIIAHYGKSGPARARGSSARPLR